MSTSRRTFLCSLGAVSTMGAALRAAADPLIEYVRTGCSIDVVETRRGRRVLTQSVTSARPSFLTLDARGRFLFVANEIDNYRDLPSGSVESYAIERGSGHLALIGRQSLSLSATMPRHLAVSPDGHHLVVPAYGGGAYNVIPIGTSGELGPVTQAVKEIGHSVHPERQRASHPHSAVFHPEGSLLFSTDLGADRINVFRFEAGMLSRVHRIAAAPGSGPSDIWMDTSGHYVDVRHEFVSLISRYGIDRGTGHLTLVNQYNRLA